MKFAHNLFAGILSFALLVSISSCSSGTNNNTTSTDDISVSNSITDSSNQSSSEPDTAASTADSSDSSTSEEQPMVIPEPIVYTGAGDDVISIEPLEGIWVLTITGNSGAHHFAVKGYDDASNYTELFVNTTEPYVGTTLDPSLSTTMLEITASGDWTIELRSVYEMETISAGQSISGTGDTVMLVSSPGKTATISGNADSHHFAVKSYGFTADDLMVNTTDPYEGKVMLKGDPFLITVDSEGDWTIALN